MSNCVAFHNQIASIMEVLANAAVAEICQVVDDGYAVLRLEMSQCQKENKALKRRLQTMERLSARRCAERAGSRALFADDAQLGRKLGETPRACPLPAKVNLPTVERVMDNRMDASQKRDEQLIVLDEEDPPAVRAGRSDGVTSHQNATTSTQCADMEADGTEGTLIKEERLRENLENPHHQRELQCGDQRRVELEAGSKGSPPSTDTLAASAKQEQFPEQQAEDGRGVWEGGALAPGPETDTERDRAKSLQQPGPEPRTQRPDCLDSEFGMFESPGRLGSFCPQGGAVAETEDPCCSYSSGAGTQGLCYGAEMRPFGATEEGGGRGLSPLGSLDWKPDGAGVKLEPEARSVWDVGTALGLGDAPGRRPFEEIGESGEMLPESVPDVCPAPFLTAGSSFAAAAKSEAHRRAAEKRPFYSYFEGGFGRPGDGETPPSAAPEERQFGCAQCGKHFAHMANLKRHQRVHTGEKPYSCALCEKRFSHQHQLKMHQRVHTGERPFNCTHCGKRFTQSSHIKRHLLVHTGVM